jgi:hypothetical protein
MCQIWRKTISILHPLQSADPDARENDVGAGHQTDAGARRSWADLKRRMLLQRWKEGRRAKDGLRVQV